MKESCRLPWLLTVWWHIIGLRRCHLDRKAEAGKWKGMVFIPRAQPLCRPVSLPMTLRGEAEGILSFLPSISVKSFIIQLPDYFKNLTRLWFLTVFVHLTVCERERGALPVVRCTPWLSPTPLLPTPFSLIPHTPTSPNSSAYIF